MMNKKIYLTAIVLTLLLISGCQLAKKEVIIEKTFVALQLNVESLSNPTMKEVHIIPIHSTDEDISNSFEISDSMYDTEINMNVSDNENLLIVNTNMKLIYKGEVSASLTKIYIDSDGILSKENISGSGLTIANTEFGGTYTIGLNETDETNHESYDIKINIEVISPIQNVITYGYNEQHELLFTQEIHTAESFKKDASFYLIDFIYLDGTKDTILDKDFNLFPINSNFFIIFEPIFNEQ